MHFELFHVVEINQSPDGCVNKTLCLLRRDEVSLLGPCRARSGRCRRLLHQLLHWAQKEDLVIVHLYLPGFGGAAPSLSRPPT